MKNSAPNEDRIQRAIEGLLSEAEMDALKRDVIADADLRAAYAEQVWLHSSLRAERETLPPEDGPPHSSTSVRR